MSSAHQGGLVTYFGRAGTDKFILEESHVIKLCNSVSEGSSAD
jgi:hypothetical protein